MVDEEVQKEVIDIDEEDYDDIKESPPLAEQIEIKRPEEIIKTETEKSYDAVIEEQPELKQYLEYMRIKKKFASQKPLTAEEQQFKNDMDLAVKRDKEAEEQQEEQLLIEAEKQKAKQDEIKREYEETKKNEPHKIIQTRSGDITLTGGESLGKLLKFIFAMKKARKKGGKVLVQVFRNRKVMVKWTTNDITFVEFYTTDEKGNELMEVTRFSEYPYSFEGTPVPVLFAVQGFAEGFDFFSEFRKDLSSEMVSRLITRAFHAGYLKGAEVAQPNKKNNMFESLMPFMPIIMIAGFAILGYLLYSMYQDNTTMLNTMQSLSTQIQTLTAQRVADMNTLVLR